MYFDLGGRHVRVSHRIPGDEPSLVEVRSVVRILAVRIARCAAVTPLSPPAPRACPVDAMPARLGNGELERRDPRACSIDAITPRRTRRSAPWGPRRMRDRARPPRTPDSGRHDGPEGTIRASADVARDWQVHDPLTDARCGPPTRPAERARRGHHRSGRRPTGCSAITRTGAPLDAPGRARREMPALGDSDRPSEAGEERFRTPTGRTESLSA